MSRGTEISVGRFLIEYFTPLTLERQHQSALSDEDVTDVWAAAKLEAIRKVRKMTGGTGMGGGSFASGLRSTFRQGKRVVRDHEDVWD